MFSLNIFGTQDALTCVSLAQHKSLVWQFDTQSPSRSRSREEPANCLAAAAASLQSHDLLRKKIRSTEEKNTEKGRKVRDRKKEGIAIQIYATAM